MFYSRSLGLMHFCITNFVPVISNLPFSPSPAPGNHHSTMLLRV